MPESPDTQPSPVTAVSHSATASALGYLHQTQWGLLELLRRKRTEPDARLTLEMHDDVAWDVGGTAVELKQIKLHTHSVRSLGNSSIDLWRTIGVWLDQGRPSDAYGPILTLVSNSSATDGSIAALLRSGSPLRNPEQALALLEKAATDSTNDDTAKARNRFLKLDPADRAAFVGRMFIADNSPDFDAVESEIEDLLRPGAPPEHFSTYMDQVWGWWSRVARSLLQHKGTITVGQMLSGISGIRDQFTSDNLPPLVDPNELDLPGLHAEHLQRTYVQQLHWIDLPARPIQKAIIDYQRSYLQETRWLDRHLVDFDELDRFTTRLVDEWERAYDFMCSELPDEANETDRKRAGRRLLQKLSESPLAIRARFEDPFFSRGRRHALADVGQLGWHPEFQRHVEALLLGEEQPA